MATCGSPQFPWLHIGSLQSSLSVLPSTGCPWPPMVPFWVPMVPTQCLQHPQHSTTWMPTLGATSLSQGTQEDLNKEPLLVVLAHRPQCPQHNANAKHPGRVPPCPQQCPHGPSTESPHCWHDVPIVPARCSHVLASLSHFWDDLGPPHPMPPRATDKMTSDKFGHPGFLCNSRHLFLSPSVYFCPQTRGLAAGGWHVSPCTSIFRGMSSRWGGYA